MRDWRYTKGLHDLGGGCHAYLQPDGSWGWSNAGLIVGDDRALLVDTLFDLRLTRTMLEAMAPLTQRRPIRTLVNTHANGDHCWGNQLVTDAEIVASRACGEEMLQLQPEMLAALVTSDGLGAAGEYAKSCFGAFDFTGIVVRPPDRTFDGLLTLEVAGKRVDLIEVGPAHTRGDVLVHVPDERTVFTGDILFIGGTPIVWEGPISNWIAACDLMLELDIETVVPGHGPVTDKRGIAEVRGYLSFVEESARACFAAGLGVEDAIREIALGAFSTWGEKERIAVNVDTAYRELRGDGQHADVMHLFELMAQLAEPSR